MIATAMRLRAFRRANGITQDEAAVLFNVDGRSVRRWEAGGALPAEVQAIISKNNPLIGSMVRGLCAIVRHTEGLMVLVDDELVVIENSNRHKQRMLDLFGIDIVGRSWLDFMTPEAKAWVDEEGGLQAIVDRGFVYSVFPYRREVTTIDGIQELCGVSYFASVWIGNGTHMGLLTFTDAKPGDVLPEAKHYYADTADTED